MLTLNISEAYIERLTGETSPNLNLIERLWKYIKKDVIGDQYFESTQIFHQAIVQAMTDINHCPVLKG